jgi:hypothetical protein
MSMQRTWSILAAGLLAAGCAAAGRPEPQHGGDEHAPPVTEEPNAFPGEDAPAPSEAPSTPESSNYEFHDEAPAAAPPAPEARHAAGGADLRGYDESARASRGAAPAKKSARALDLEPERPGLGTTWGETRTSRVSNAPFERSSSNPFSLTSIHYNDSSGVAALLHGSAPVAYRTDAATLVSNGAVSVRLVDANGSPLPTFTTASGALVQGEVGQRYQIELVNETSSRFEAVVTVDGLDVIDGRPGAFSKRGYLLQPFATLDIDGFRQNMDEVAAFRFGSVRGSYAAQKGNDRNVGVVGVALFAERGASRPWSERELRRRETADPFPGRFAAPPLAR